MSSTRNRHHQALALAHRWFGYLETSWGNTEAQLEIFTDDVVLSGRRGEIIFANDHATMRRWFDAVPDETSAHRIIHHSWNEVDAQRGRLNFLVAYQVPGEQRPGGAIISYTTDVVFDDGHARFERLDKTPILPNEDPDYHPTWAEHRALATVHLALAGDLLGDGYDGLARDFNGCAAFEARAPVQAPAEEFTAVITAVDDHARVRTSRWAFTDTAESVFPTPGRTDACPPDADNRQQPELHRRIDSLGARARR